MKILDKLQHRKSRNTQNIKGQMVNIAFSHYHHSHDLKECKNIGSAEYFPPFLYSVLINECHVLSHNKVNCERYS